MNLRGATVVPGFIDAHIHFLSYGLSLQEIDLSGAATLSSALERVGERVVDTPAGQWLTGRGWDQSIWEGGAFPEACTVGRGRGGASGFPGAQVRSTPRG